MLKNSGDSTGTGIKGIARGSQKPRLMKLSGTSPVQNKNASSSIGTKKESSLHRSLKFQYSGSDGDTETIAGSYVCDGRTREGELIEVQTGSFGPLREKIETLTQNNRVRIIHPVIAQKYIELYDKGGRLLHRRKSPRKGSLWDLFDALIYAPELPLRKNLCIELAVVDVVEKRIDDGKGSWRRKGVRITDRLLDTWHYSVILKSKKDYFQFVPFKKARQFTVRDLSAEAGINNVLARKVLYTIMKMGLIKRIGKQGRAWVYKRG